VRAETLHRDDGGHDFARRGDLEPAVLVLRPEHGAVGGVDQDRALRGDLDPMPGQGSALMEQGLTLPGGSGHEREHENQREQGECAHAPRVTLNPAA
jgi:hypothetical protein